MANRLARSGIAEKAESGRGVTNTVLAPLDAAAGNVFDRATNGADSRPTRGYASSGLLKAETRKISMQRHNETTRNLDPSES